MNKRGYFRAHLGLFFVIAIVLFGTTDDRFPGSTADGRQMIWTAVALAETGSLGQARGRDLTVPRAEGDSVSRFGLAMSVAQVPAAILAPVVESRLGPATSQPLFLIAPFVFVLIAGGFAGFTVHELGGGLSAQRAAILFATLAGPLGAYAALDASESLQAASLIVALWAAVSGRSLLAGLAAGIAILTKSSLIVVAPLMLLPLLTGTGGLRRVTTDNGTSRLLKPVVAFSVPLALWLYLEISRFGAPLMGYAGESFSHSPIDGAWRLLVGLNKGLIWYFPALVAGVLSRRLAVYLPSVLGLAALLATASGWWAWHGDDGWGPRLLVAAVPPLAVCAALAMERWKPSARIALLAASVALNLPPLVQHPTPVFHYRLAASWPQADPSFAATLPRFAQRELDGKTLVVPESVLATVPRASPFLVLPWYFTATHAGSETERAEALRRPPWLAARSDITPSEAMVTAVASAPTRWRFWGGSFLTGGVSASSGAYDLGLADQVLRAQTLRSLTSAERLSRKLLTVAPGGYADALLLETFRLSRRRSEAVHYLQSLPQDRRQHPAINVVLALFERDAGNADAAKAFLETVVTSFPNSPVERALAQPLAQWPPDFAAITQDDHLQVDMRRPAALR